MSQTETTGQEAAPGEADAPEGDDHGAHAGHPTPRQYVQIAVILALLTAMEISLIYVEVGVAMIPTLIVLMVLKFALVVGWYMHLKFDAATFTRLLLTGLVLAVAIYAVVLVTFLDVARPS